MEERGGRQKRTRLGSLGPSGESGWQGGDLDHIFPGKPQAFGYKMCRAIPVWWLLFVQRAVCSVHTRRCVQPRLIHVSLIRQLVPKGV